MATGTDRVDVYIDGRYIGQWSREVVEDLPDHSDLIHDLLRHAMATDLDADLIAGKGAGVATRSGQAATR
jgi:hypothetical protein